MSKHITFGADPELFITNESGVAIPAVGLIGGTKDKPRMVGEYGLQEDNVMAEYTVPPAANIPQLIERAQLGLRTTIRAAREKVPGAGYLRSPVAMFDHGVLLAAGPQAAQFGCSPDFDAYANGAAHPRVSPDVLVRGTSALRFAGGHIHLGYKDLCPDVPEFVVAMVCDITIGLTLVSYHECQSERRALYGKAGRYRPTPYGVEYRVPSNAWLYDPEVRTGLVEGLRTFNTVIRLGDLELSRFYNEAPWPDVAAAINSEHRHLAYDIIEWVTSSYATKRESL